MIANYAMLEAIRQGNHGAAFETLMVDIINVAGWIADFAAGAWILASELYFPPGDRRMLEFNIDVAPDIDDVELPFFVEMPSKPLSPTGYH